MEKELIKQAEMEETFPECEKEFISLSEKITKAGYIWDFHIKEFIKRRFKAINDEIVLSNQCKVRDKELYRALLNLKCKLEEDLGPKLITKS